VKDSILKRLLNHSFREKAGLVFLVLFSLFSILNTVYYKEIIEHFAVSKMRGYWISLSITRYENQLDCLRAELDPSKEVGFITTLPLESANEYYALTQYALAPVLLGKSERYPLVIGYGPNPNDIETLMNTYPSLRIVKQCKNGVVLFGVK
jgi:hypothetical protein